MRSARPVLSVALALIAFAACSSDDSSSSTTATTTDTTAAPSSAPSTTESPTTQPAAPTVVASTLPATTAPATTPPTVVASTLPPTTAPSTTEAPSSGGDAELIALAESALIDLSVFPDGWTESPPAPDEEPSEDDEAFEQQVDECLGLDDAADESDLLEAREARSGEFSDPTADNQPGVEHLVTVADDEAMAIRSMERAGTDGAAGCLQQTLQAFFDADPEFQDDESGIELGDLTVTRLDLDGDPTLRLGYRIEIPLSLGDQTFIQYLEVLYQRQGRALSQLQFSSFGVPFPEEGFVSLSDDVTIRLATIGG